MEYYLTVAAIVKNEALYIEEWICFHLYQGVQHFFIYENDSTDNTYKILKKYERAGIVTLEKIHGLGQQFPFIEKCLKDNGSKSRWMAFLDCDEFLFAETKLTEFLKEYEVYSCVAAHWFLYGSREVEGSLVIERFPYRQEDVNKHVKSIIQPEKTISRGKDSHSFFLITPAVNENKIPLRQNYATKSPPSANKIRINHYHVKSWDEYFTRKSMPRVSTGTMIKNIQESFRHHDRNEVLEPFPYKVIESVKDYMGRIRENLL